MQSTPIQMLTPGGSICGRSTYDLPLSCPQGGSALLGGVGTRAEPLHFEDQLLSARLGSHPTPSGVPFLLTNSIWAHPIGKTSPPPHRPLHNRPRFIFATWKGRARSRCTSSISSCAQIWGWIGTSFTRKCTPLGPYRRPMSRVLGGS